MANNVIEIIKQVKLVPVVVLKSLDDVDSTVLGLSKGNVPIAEVCYRTDCAGEAIKLINKKYPNFLVGAGTVINKKQCKEAISNGAKFIVSPGFALEVYKEARKHNVPYLPGVVTPTEVITAISYGLTYLKFFPAGVFGGLKAIKALSAAFPSVKFMPTGGVDNSNLSEFIKEKCIFAIGGSWLLKGDIVKNCEDANKIIKENNNG